ncbi:MAG: thioredoxin family protein [Bacteroidales bacterium]|jgi:thioredoxin 1|nr:thioredoxin family protein [Bacteroidales bacterium]
MNTNIKTVESLDTLNEILEKQDAVLLYFSHDKCNVCKVLKPKIAELLAADFPKMEMHYVNTEELPEVAGQHRVFAVPSILVFFQGRESFRYSRNLSVTELAATIERLYSMLFNED